MQKGCHSSKECRIMDMVCELLPGETNQCDRRDHHAALYPRPPSGKFVRCLIPRFDGAILSQEWKEALWDKFVTGAPRSRSPSEQQYSDPLPGRALRCNGPRGASFDVILQINGYTGYNRLTRPSRKGGDPVRVVHCWPHARRKLKEVFDRDGSEIAAEGLRHIAEFYVIKANIRDISPGQRQSSARQPVRPEPRRWWRHSANGSRRNA